MIRRLASPLALVAVLAASAAGAAPAPAPIAPPLRLAASHERRLANGLRVVVFPSSSQPIVQAQLLVPAGAAEEPDSLPGLAALTARVVGMGSASREPAQLQADLGALGATFATSAGRDYAIAVCGSRAPVFEATLEILADAVLSPRLADDEFEAGRRAAVQQLRAKAQTEGLLADDRLWGLAFDPHPYGHPEAGDIDGIVASRLEHVRAFVRDRWRPDRAVLAIAGDVAPERAFAAAESTFARWAGRTSADRVRREPVGTTGVQVLDLAASPRGEVRVAVRGPGRASPQLAAWQVAVAALEERLAGTAASVSFTPMRDASLLVLAEGGPVDSARAVARRLTAALKAFAAAPPAGEAAAALARHVARSAPLALETMGARLSRWQADDFAGLPGDALGRALTAPPSVPDLGPVARAFGEAPVVFATGPADKLKSLLAPLGAITVVPFAPRRSSRPDTLAVPTESEVRAGRAAIAAAVTAHGGATRLAAVKVTVAEGDIGVDSRGQQMDGQFSLVRIDPSRLSYSTKMLSFEVRQVLDGDAGWTLALADSASLNDADSIGVASLKAMLQGDLVHILRAASAPGSLPAQRGRETIGGKAVDLVDFTVPGGQRLRLALDATSRRVVAVDGSLGPDLVWHERRTFSEWKTVSGLLLPGYEERFVDGERILFQRARAISVNPPIDEKLFKRPRVVRGQVLPGN